MGKVIAFSELPAYLARLESLIPASKRATILDTNVLITWGYDVRNDHEVVIKALEILFNHGYRFLATVNIKAEFLEFRRRTQLT